MNLQLPWDMDGVIPYISSHYPSELDIEICTFVFHKFNSVGAAF